MTARPGIPLFLLLLTSFILLNSTGAKAAESVRRVDGYKGIWFTLGQFYGKGEGDQPYAKASKTPVFPYGDKYSGGLGTYTAKHNPLAIYCPEVDKTFFVYGGTTASDQRHLLCMISYYDHRKNRVPKPVVVYDKQGVDDPHDNPSLAVDEKGYLWVFVSGRGRVRPGFKYRSTAPYSIDGFEQITEEELTYPQPKYLPRKGFLHLFTKYTGVRELYFETSADGVTWSEDRKLAGIREPGHRAGGHYQTSAILGERVGTFFNRHPKGNPDDRTDIYYAETSDMGATWTSIDGKPLALPLTEVENPARVHDYASEGLNVYLKNMGFDRDGHPVFLYVTGPGHEPGPPNAPRHFRITRWDGGGWKTATICETDHNYDMGSLSLSPGKWTALLPSDPGPQPWHGGGEMVLWESADQGASWQKVRQVTAGSERNHNYARLPIHAKDPFFAFWTDGDPTRLSECQIYFTDSTGKKLWRLPHEMSDDFAEPELVKGR